MTHDDERIIEIEHFVVVIVIVITVTLSKGYCTHKFSFEKSKTQNYEYGTHFFRVNIQKWRRKETSRHTHNTTTTDEIKTHKNPILEVQTKKLEWNLHYTYDGEKSTWERSNKSRKKCSKFRIRWIRVKWVWVCVCM